MRYNVATYVGLELDGMLTIAGPQDESQVPEGVKQLLDLNDGIKMVVVIYDHGLGEHADVFTLRPEEVSKGE